MQHRAVAAERDDEVEPVGELLGVAPRGARARPPPPRLRARAPRRRARATTPAARCASSCASGALAVRDETDCARALWSRRSVGDGATASASAASIVVGAATRVREELDVAVGAARAATGSTRATPSPCSSRPATTSSSTARVHVGVADDPALADAVPARLELRLHEQHEVGGVGGEREQGRRDRPQRDERHVGDAEIGRRLERSGSSSRTLVRSITVTRASLRKRPRELAAADVDRDRRARAPRCSRQSVKPPVDAPTSRQRRPRTSTANASSAAASFTPPRDTNCAAGAATVPLGSARQVIHFPPWSALARPTQSKGRAFAPTRR